MNGRQYPADFLAQDAAQSIRDQVFSLLYDSAEVETGIQRALEFLGQFAGASRVYVFGSSADGRYSSNLYEWCGRGVEPMIDRLQNVDMHSDCGAFYRLFDKTGTFYLRVEDIHPAAVRKLLSSQGIVSLTVTAIMEHGTIRGYVGYDFCQERERLSEEDLKTLRLGACIIGVFVLKQRAQAQVDRANEEKIAVMDQLPLPVYLVDSSFTIRFFNRRMKGLAPRLAVGQSCYRALANRETPCPGCLLRRLEDSTEQSVSELMDRFGGRVAASISRIRWDGQEMYLTVCQDVTQLLQEHDSQVVREFLLGSGS